MTNSERLSLIHSKLFESNVQKFSVDLFITIGEDFLIFSSELNALAILIDNDKIARPSAVIKLFKPSSNFSRTQSETNSIF